MREIIISLVLSLISSFCYDAIKSIFQERKQYKSNSSVPYSSQYIKAIKKEFYICFPLGILFLYMSRTSNNWLQVFNLIMAFWMFFFTLTAFICSIEVINHFANKNTKNNTK